MFVCRKMQNEIVGLLRLEQPLGRGAAVVDRQQPEFPLTSCSGRERKSRTSSTSPFSARSMTWTAAGA